MSKISPEWVKNQEVCAFPVVKPPLKPLKNLVLVQYRNSRVNERKTAGGLIVVQDGGTKKGAQDRWNNLTVKIIAVGPLAFHTRNLDTGKLMPFSEGNWFKVGDYVRVPAQGVDFLFVEPSKEELRQMNIDSENAEKLKEPYEFKATEGLASTETAPNKFIKMGLVEDTDILALIQSFNTVLNGH